MILQPLRSRHLLGLALAAGVLTATGGAGASTPDLTFAAQPAAAEAARGAAAKAAKPDRIVIAISIDGFNPTSIGKLGAARTPAFHRLIKQGATTLNARTAYELTTTLPNHTGMMTGRRVTGPTGHHVDFNSDNGKTLRGVNGHYIRGIFDGVHDRGRATALYTDKDKFRFLARSWDAKHGAVDRIGANNGRDKLTRFVFADPGALVSRLTQRLKTDPDDLSFLHLALPDHAGHKYGFMSTRYLDAVDQTDAQVGKVLRTISQDRYLRAHTRVVLTADHGGKPGSHGHGQATLRANYRIPFMVWGAGVARGRGIYKLNPTRTWPGTGRPTYAGEQPIRNIDVAGLVCKLLGVPGVPGGQLAGTIPLKVR